MIVAGFFVAWEFKENDEGQHDDDKPKSHSVYEHKLLVSGGSGVGGFLIESERDVARWQSFEV